MSGDKIRRLHQTQDQLKPIGKVRLCQGSVLIALSPWRENDIKKKKART